MFVVSVRMRVNFSPARNVRSTTAPVSSDFSFVRTNAPPFPGFTCWNSTMRQTLPSSSMCMPFLNWFVLTVSATASENLADLDQVLAEVREVVDAAVGDNDVVLDPDPAEAFEIDARLDRDDVPEREKVRPFLAHARSLVDLQADAVTEPVAEAARELRRVDDLACCAIGVDAGETGANRLERGGLRIDTDAVRFLQLVRKRSGRERARVV